MLRPDYPQENIDDDDGRNDEMDEAELDLNKIEEDMLKVENLIWFLLKNQLVKILIVFRE